MKHLLTFDVITESTSAYSQDRGSSEYTPFKYAKNYDPKLGYSKIDFLKDLASIYRESSKEKQRELTDLIYRETGVFKMSDIEKLSNDKIDLLQKSLEHFLSTKADHKMLVLPDGYVLCYEDLMQGEIPVDIYYSPYLKKIKIAYTNRYPESREMLVKIDLFDPNKFGIKNDDFQNIIRKCEVYSQRL